VALAGVGLYGLMAYRVRRRVHEIAVRMALGARPASVLSLVLRESLTLVLIGAAIGAAAAVTAAHVASVVLYQVSAADLWALIAAVGSVIGVAALAAFRPARRAIRIDPMATLGSE
jgi:putative ABC transport system permease protein